MDQNEALKQIENALNVAIQKGIFADMQSAAYIFNCLTVLKQSIGNGSGNNSE